MKNIFIFVEKKDIILDKEEIEWNM